MENACGMENIAYSLWNIPFSQGNMVAAEGNMQYSRKNGPHSVDNIICGFVTGSKSTSYVAMKHKLHTKALL